MSNLVPKARRREGNPTLLANKITNSTLKCTIVDSSGWTAVDTVDKFSEIPSGARLSGATVAVSSPAWNSTTLQLTCTSPVAIPNVPAGSGNLANGEILVFWFDTGTESTSPVEVVIDTFASGMPVTPDGRTINVTIPSGLLAQY